jgi:hypothetical protein
LIISETSILIGRVEREVRRSANSVGIEAASPQQWLIISRAIIDGGGTVNNYRKHIRKVVDPAMLVCLIYEHDNKTDRSAASSRETNQFRLAFFAT